MSTRTGMVLLLVAMALSLTGCGGGMSTFRSVDVQATLTEIHKAAKQYDQQFHRWPSEVSQLENAGLISIKDRTKEQWRFTILSEEIVARSTDEFPEGEGHEIIFNFFEDQFYGYGVREGGWR